MVGEFRKWCKVIAIAANFSIGLTPEHETVFIPRHISVAGIRKGDIVEFEPENMRPSPQSSRIPDKEKFRWFGRGSRIIARAETCEGASEAELYSGWVEGELRQ